MAEAPVTVRVVRLAHAADLRLPEAASVHSAGLDVRAANDNDIDLDPGARARVPTGLVLEIPHGWEGQVRPRSGLAARHGVTVANSPGTIDSDYRGEVQVLLVNLGREPFTIRRGDRIAQLVISAVPTVNVVEVSAVDGTDRGGGGFGSTGLS
ncbi:MAG: dUTP diphosphatase [Acidobacteriota bacterium]|nr:dUTP diphosphatase [Acidobacteriota bacterium]